MQQNFSLWTQWIEEGMIMQRNVPRLILVGLVATTLPASGQLFPFQSGDRLSIVPSSDQSESYLGIYLSDVTPELVDQLSLKEEAGAHVNQVVAGAPADKAGILVDDVIMRWNRQRVESAMQFTRLVRETPPGRKANLEIFRDGGIVKTTVKVGTRDPWAASHHHHPFDHVPSHYPPSEPGQLWHDQPFGDLHARRNTQDQPRLGIIMQPLTTQLAAYFGLEDRLGALISMVMEDTPAQQAGLQAGDVVLAIGDHEVASPRDVQRNVRSIDGQSMTIRLMRKGEQIEIIVPLTTHEPSPPEASSEEPEESSVPVPPDSM